MNSDRVVKVTQTKMTPPARNVTGSRGMRSVLHLEAGISNDIHFAWPLGKSYSNQQTLLALKVTSTAV
jgi:hypothetical protein